MGHETPYPILFPWTIWNVTGQRVEQSLLYVEYGISPKVNFCFYWMLLKHVSVISLTKRYHLWTWLFELVFLDSRLLNKCKCAENRFGLANWYAPYSDKNPRMMTTWLIWDWECCQCTQKMILKVFSRTGLPIEFSSWTKYMVRKLKILIYNPWKESERSLFSVSKRYFQNRTSLLAKAFQ